MDVKIILLALLFALSAVTASIQAGGMEQRSRYWMIYMGGFGGIYNPWFRYGSVYFSQRPANEALNNDAFQPGYSGGGQVGIQYHGQTSYFLGLVFSGMSNSRNARLTHFIETFRSAFASPATAFNINHVFKIDYNLDIAGLFGFDVTPRSHLYTKAGASYMRLVHYMNTTTAQSARYPTVYYQNTQHDYGWGWLIGLGFTQDFNRWISAFAEYDYYNRGARNLTQQHQIAPRISGTQRDVLTQNLTIKTSSIRFGLNLKFTNQLLPDVMLHAINHWVIYLGGFGAVYQENFAYSGNYYSGSRISNTVFNNLSIQDSYSGGGQIGIQYHFSSPYFIGIEGSILGVGARTATLSNFVDDSISGNTSNMSITHVFRSKRVSDIVGIFGMRITPKTRVYTKGGGSYARLGQETYTTPSRNSPLPTVFVQDNQKLWARGWLIGLGIIRDLNQWLSVFAEYDHYDYAGHAFNTLYKIAPRITSAQNDTLTHRATTTASTVRLGLNFKLIDTFSNMPDEQIWRWPHWVIYMGILGGINSADFKYGSNYYLVGINAPNSNNEVFNNNLIQRGVFGGGQIGIQYHFNKPYYLGMVFDAAKPAEKAYLSNTMTSTFIGFAINSRMRVNYHLDMSVLIGADVTQKTHIYVKTGGSYARIMDYVFTTQSNAVNNFNPFSQNIQHKYKSGWLAGLGVTYDINRWVNVFSEYDHYDYRKPTLSNLYNIGPSVLASNGRHDRLEQQLSVTTDTVRVGLNITFAF